MLLNFNTVSRIIHVCVRQRHPAFLQRSGQRGPAGSAAPRSPGMKRTTSSPITPLASSSGRNRHQTSPGRTPRRHEEEWLRGGLLPALPAPLAPGPPPRHPPSHQQLSTEQLRLRQAVQEPDCSKDSLLTLFSAGFPAIPHLKGSLPGHLGWPGPATRDGTSV